MTPLSDISQLILRAVETYGLRGEAAIIGKITQGGNGDLQFSISVSTQRFSARLMRRDRRYSPAFFYTDELLAEQLRVGDWLVARGIPFMRRVPPVDGSFWKEIEYEGKPYRLLLFEWQEGRQEPFATEPMAGAAGAMLRRIHDALADFPAQNLPRRFHAGICARFVSEIRGAAANVNLSPEAKRGLEEYLCEAERHIAAAQTSAGVVIAVQGDLNLPNVFWSDDLQEVRGIVDFDQIGMSERIEDLAWVVKWYARTATWEQETYSSVLANAVLEGYGTGTALSAAERQRLPHVLWLAGCMNYAFRQKVLLILGSADTRRGAQLLRLLSGCRELGTRLGGVVERGELNP